jgi:preprotein translocase subunit YajC
LAIFASGALSVFISSAFAQSPFGAGGTESLMSFLPIVLMFGVLYFLMIRPQMKRQKEHKQMIDSLAKGDEVLAASGMVGKISKIGEAYVSVEVARVSVERGPDQVFEVQMQKSAVQQVLPKGTIKAIQ